jgi:hypothetical protein
MSALVDRFTPTSGQRATAATLREALRAPARSPSLLLVTGDPGAGKSAMLPDLLDDLAGDLALGVVISDDAHADGRLLRSMIAAFDEAPAGRSGLDLLTQLRATFAARAGAGRRPVLLIDGAERLTGSQLEIVRSLLTPAADDTAPTAPPVAIVLVGRPELNERIRRRRPLARRRTHDLRLAGPDRDDLARVLDSTNEVADAVIAAAGHREIAPLALAGLLRRDAGDQHVTEATLETVLRRVSAGAIPMRQSDAIQTAMPFATAPAIRNGASGIRQLSLLHVTGGDR